MKINRISKASNYIMIIFFSVLIIVGPVFAVSENNELLAPLIFGSISVLGIYYFFPYFKIKKRPLVICVILSLLCFIVKFIWIYKVRITPMDDYETYFNYAKALSENFFAQNRYVALFPHIFGYSWFLSFFMKIFGTGELLVPVINVIFSIISGVLIFRISYRLAGVRAATFAYLMWILCPSQTMYNSLVFADLFYTTMILAFIVVVTELTLSSKAKHTSTLLLGLSAGIILRFVNITRPIAAVLIIAVFIWLLVLNTKEWTVPKFRKKWIPFLIMLVACYFISGLMWNNYVERRLGENVASVPGYNIAVGFNMDSLGTWNTEDSKRLGNYSDTEGATAILAQEQMMNFAKERILSGNINFPKLLKNKLMTFLGTDTSAVDYHSSVLADSKKPLEILSNTFYYAVVVLALFAFPSLCKQSHNTTVSIILLYVIGLTLAQMLVEVAGRYHYSIMPMLILTASYGLFSKNMEVEEDGRHIVHSSSVL